MSRRGLENELIYQRIHRGNGLQIAREFLWEMARTENVCDYEGDPFTDKNERRYIKKTNDAHKSLLPANSKAIQ